MKLRQSTLEPDVALKTEVNRWMKELTAVATAGREPYHELVSKQVSQVPAWADSAAEDAAPVATGGDILQSSFPMPDLTPMAAASPAQHSAPAAVRSRFGDRWAAGSYTGMPRAADAAPASSATIRKRPLPLAATRWADIMQLQASPATLSAVGGNAALIDSGEKYSSSSSCNSNACEDHICTAMGGGLC